MKTVHNIAFGSSPDLARRFRAWGLEVADSGFVALEIDEESLEWRNVAEWVRCSGCVHRIESRFSSVEMRDAEWLQMRGDWQCGFPQPKEDEFGYLKHTYGDCPGCARCGAGRVQSAPFMMKKAPAWGQRAIAQLHWVYDEWFVVREKYQNCLEGMGVGCREVVDRQGREIAGVVQLVVDREVQVDLGGLIQEESECCECRRKKFLPVTVGMGPTVVAPARGVNICKSSAWFGSGGQAFQLSIVSQAFRKAVMDCGIRGVSFRPLAVSSA